MEEKELRQSFDKVKIVEELKEKVNLEINKAKEAYGSSRNLATSSEAKSEGKYDTRSIEAGYIAGAQKKRLDELELELGLLDEINTSHSPENVSVGSLTAIEFNGAVRYYFISSTSGGSILNIDDLPILVISAFSPIGTEAIGLSAGDSFDVETAKETRSYKIIKIL